MALYQINKPLQSKENRENRDKAEWDVTFANHSFGKKINVLNM